MVLNLRFAKIHFFFEIVDFAFDSAQATKRILSVAEVFICVFVCLLAH